jgi:hypothetical protein
VEQGHEWREDGWDSAPHPGANPETNHRDRDLPIRQILNSPPALTSPPLADFSALANLF